MHPRAADPIYEVVNRRTGIIAMAPEFVPKPFHDHPNCASYQRLLQEGNYAFYSPPPSIVSNARIALSFGKQAKLPK